MRAQGVASLVKDNFNLPCKAQHTVQEILKVSAYNARNLKIWNFRILAWMSQTIAFPTILALKYFYLLTCLLSLKQVHHMLDSSEKMFVASSYFEKFATAKNILAWPNIISCFLEFCCCCFVFTLFTRFLTCRSVRCNAANFAAISVKKVGFLRHFLTRSCTHIPFRKERSYFRSVIIHFFC